jgi:ABC-type branched-subunit amino acid transport system substrate-binding protein
MSNTLVGVLVDYPFTDQIKQLFVEAHELAFSEAYEDGVIDRPIDLVIEECEGLPSGSTHAAIEAWKRLADQGVVMIEGPFVSENGIPVRDHVEDAGHVPTIMWGGSDLLYGDWCFAISNGSLPEEPYLMANYLAHEGIDRVGVIFDDSAIGNEYLTFFRAACRHEGLRIVAQEPISQIEQDLSAAAGANREAGADGLVYLGFGLPGVHINTALQAMNWDPPRVMTTAFLTAPYTPLGMKSLFGWAGVDQYDETNPIGQSVIDRFEHRFGYRPANFYTLVCYDVANVIAHAIGNARPLSPAGVRQGMYGVRMLPAACGGPKTLISFAPWNHRAWLGPDYLVVRKVVSDADVSPIGDLGTELVHRITPRTREARRRH